MNLNEFEKEYIAFNNMQLIEFDHNKVIEKFKEIISKNSEEILKILKIKKSIIRLKILIISC